MRIYDHYAMTEKRRQHRWSCGYEISLWGKYADESLGDCAEIEQEMIKWIKETVKGKAHCAGDMKFGFELEQDLILFKLTWG